MSDIPDWLVELAAQRDAEEGGEEEEEGPFVEAPPTPVVEYEEPEPATLSEVTPTTGEPEDDDLMAALRSQVELEDAEEAPVEKRSFSLDLSALSIPGLLPWQQFVLAVLLFLDIVVVGLLFLVMLGRVGIP